MPSLPGGRGGAGVLVDVYNGIILPATFTTRVPYALCVVADLFLTVLKPARGVAHAALFGSLACVRAYVSIIGAGPETACGFAGLLVGLSVYVWLQRRQFAPDATGAEVELSHAIS